MQGTADQESAVASQGKGSIGDCTEAIITAGECVASKYFAYQSLFCAERMEDGKCEEEQLCIQGLELCHCRKVVKVKILSNRVLEHSSACFVLFCLFFCTQRRALINRVFSLEI